MNKIKNRSMFLLWSGAAISIAEIYTGGIIAPLGISKGILAIVLGHIIGGLLLATGGVISFSGKKNAMDKVRDTLGVYGAKIVALLNVLQLLGWSAIMIIQGARGINSSLRVTYNLSLIIMAVLVFIWAYYFENKSKIINDAAVLLLFILVAVIFFKVNIVGIIPSRGSISFMTAVEVAIAMPVSWLPLIGDYTMKGESREGVFVSSFLGYFLGSCAMYTLGLIITVFTGKDIVEFISAYSAPVIACAIIVLSTVTTTFLDVFSAVESSKQIFKIKNSNIMIGIYCFTGFVISIFFPIENYQNFLLLIGSVFVPVYTVVFIEHFLKWDNNTSKINIYGLVSAAIGTFMYNYFTRKSLFSPTIDTILTVSFIYLVSVKIFKSSRNNVESSLEA